MEINHQAPLVSHKEISIQASPEVVWKIHTTIHDWPQWQSSIDMAKLEDPLAVGSTFQWKSGGLTITSTIQLVEPNQQIGWTGKAIGTRASGSRLIFTADVTYRKGSEVPLTHLVKAALETGPHLVEHVVCLYRGSSQQDDGVPDETGLWMSWT